MRDYKTEPHIVINSDRTITVPKDLRKVAVQFDHNVETLTFDCPRYWDNIDMSEMTVYINYMRADRYRDQAEAKDVRVDENDDTLMHFTWTLTRNVTLFNGKISFLVCIKKVGEDGVELNHWNSELNQEMFVSEGLECEENVREMHSDIITDLLIRMDKILIANTPILDTTLTERGLAADAKAAGDALTAMTMKLGDKASALTNEIKTERERIDQIIGLKEGSTTGDAELLDIRTGANGIRYSTAGESVREQFKNLSSGFGVDPEFLNRQLRSYNVNNLKTANVGYFLSTDDEVIAMSESQAYTDYIPVSEGEQYLARHPWGAQWSVSFYDEFKTLIAQQSYTEDTPVSGTNSSISAGYWHCITVPKNVRYIRTNFGTGNPVNTMIVRGNSEKDIPTSYSEYDLVLGDNSFLNAVADYTDKKMNIVRTDENTVLGYSAMPISEGVRENVAVGAFALENITVDSEKDNQSGRYNVAVGGKTMKETTTGNHNTACGYQAMMSNETGSNNTAVGEDALMANVDGGCNVAVGCRALQSAISGDDNVAIGQGAGYWSDDMKPTGSRNVMVGAHSGQTDGNGSDNIAIGYFAKAKNGLNHTIVIGSGELVQKDNQTLIGFPCTEETLVRGNLIVYGQDGVKRQIVFNADGTCGWKTVT